MIYFSPKSKRWNYCLDLWDLVRQMVYLDGGPKREPLWTTLAGEETGTALIIPLCCYLLVFLILRMEPLFQAIPGRTD